MITDEQFMDILNFSFYQFIVFCDRYAKNKLEEQTLMLLEIKLSDIEKKWKQLNVSQKTAMH